MRKMIFHRLVATDKAVDVFPREGTSGWSWLSDVHQYTGPPEASGRVGWALKIPCCRLAVGPDRQRVIQEFDKF